MLFGLREEELIKSLFCLVVLIFIIFNSKQLKFLPNVKIFFSSYVFLIIGTIFDLLENLAFADIFNIVQHISYVISGVCLLLWLILVLLIKKTEDIK